MGGRVILVEGIEVTDDEAQVLAATRLIDGAEVRDRATGKRARLIWCGGLWSVQDETEITLRRAYSDRVDEGPGFVCGTMVGR